MSYRDHEMMDHSDDYSRINTNTTGESARRMPRVTQQTSQRIFQIPNPRESAHSKTNHREKHQSENEFNLMWKYIDDFIDYTKGKKIGSRPNGTPSHSRNVSSVTQDHTSRPVLSTYRRTVSKLSMQPSDLRSPDATRPGVIRAGSGIKGELKSSLRSVKNKITEAIAESDHRRQRELSEAKSRAQKAAISAPIFEGNSSQSEQMCLQRPEQAKTRVAKERASGMHTPIRRKPLPLETQTEMIKPGPENHVKFEQGQVHQSSVHVVKQEASNASMESDKRLKLQADRGTKMARTTKFGDFMADHPQVPPPVPPKDMYKAPTPIPTGWLADHIPPQNDGYQETEAQANERSRKAVKSEWLAASRECVLQRPLGIRECDFCGNEFDPETFQHTYKGQLCGDCVMTMAPCFACGKKFEAGFEQTHLGQLCKSCVGNIRPCDFCGGRVTSGFEQTNIGWLCLDCVSVKTPIIVPPHERFPLGSHNSIPSEAKPTPRSSKRMGYAPSDILPEPRLSEHPAFRQYPERSTSITQGIPAKIRQSVLKRDRSPLSMIERLQGVSNSHNDDDVSSMSDGWDSDVPSDDEPVSPKTEYTEGNRAPVIPAIKPITPLGAKLKRVASSCYPEDEIPLEPEIPVPQIPAQYRSNAYNIPATPYEEELLQERVYSKPVVQSTINREQEKADRTTYYNLLSSYQ